MTAVFADRQPADNIINAYFRERRFIGSGDRRFIAEKIWHIIRRRRRLTFEAGSADPRKLLIALRTKTRRRYLPVGNTACRRLTTTNGNWRPRCGRKRGHIRRRSNANARTGCLPKSAIRCCLRR